MPAPTQVAYAELQRAFDHFNVALFAGALSLPLFTLQREKRTFGYHSQKRFVERGTGEIVDEIAMNPAYFAIRTIPQTLSTLVHEMVHQWQFHFGKPGRGNYHNKEWAYKMEEVGLMPSKTGEPGGKRTGDGMTHYILKGGAFERTCDQLLTRAYTLSWLDRFPPVRPQDLGGSGSGLDPEGLDEDEDGEDAGIDSIDIPGVVLPSDPEERSNRQKYICSQCSAKAWGKPGLRLWCAGQDNKRIGVVEHEPLPMEIYTRG